MAMRPYDIQGKRATVIGAARSGMAVARLLASAGARVLLSELGAAPQAQRAALEASGVTVESGGHSRRALEADIFIISPGVPTTAPIVRAAQGAGLAILSELEVASWFCEAPLIAITGSNGKTTTTSLLGYVFTNAGRDTVIAGNIGEPLSTCVRDISKEAVVVLEVSSFQLDHIETFRPRVSVLLNITPDHLDRYGGDYSRYAQSKLRIFRNQRDDDVLVYNYDDTLVREHVERFGTTNDVRSIPFSYRESLQKGASLRDGAIILRVHRREEYLMEARDLALQGRHNLHNSMAAAVAARVLDVQCDVLRESLQSFEGVPHRLEFVREYDGVRYINDSKATNVNALWYALESFREPVVLLAGGRDKGNDYSSLKPLVSSNVRALIGFGESADTVIRELGHLAESAAAVATLEEATLRARQSARPGDVVLLSPACSSFDLFESYTHRGETFKRLVQRF